MHLLSDVGTTSARKIFARRVGVIKSLPTTSICLPGEWFRMGKQSPCSRQPKVRKERSKNMQTKGGNSKRAAACKIS